MSDLPALKNGHITFGSLNSFKKVSETSLGIWAQLLQEVPDSRLLLVAPPGAARERVQRLMSEHRVALTRLELVAPMPRLEYLRAYGRVDIGLDPTPYGGGTTTLDACWMGVPVVTLVGTTAVARSGAAIAYHVGLSQLATTSPREYVNCARLLAADHESLAVLRQGLRCRLQTSRLMDAPRFSQGLELTFRDLWRTWCKRATPVSSRA